MLRKMELLGCRGQSRDPRNYIRMTVFSPMMNRDPLGRSFAESLVSHYEYFRQLPRLTPRPVHNAIHTLRCQENGSSFRHFPRRFCKRLDTTERFRVDLKASTFARASRTILSLRSDIAARSIASRQPSALSS